MREILESLVLLAGLFFFIFGCFQAESSSKMNTCGFCEYERLIDYQPGRILWCELLKRRWNEKP